MNLAKAQECFFNSRVQSSPICAWLRVMVLYNFLYLPITLSWADEYCYGRAARCRIGCFIFLCARVWIVQVLMNNTLYHQAYIEGYTELLGISTYCRLNLTMTRMELLIQGNFLNLIKAELFVFAAYSYLFPSAEFYVRVTVDLSGINNVSNFLCAPFLKIIWRPTCLLKNSWFRVTFTMFSYSPSYTCSATNLFLRSFLSQKGNC